MKVQKAGQFKVLSSVLFPTIVLGLLTGCATHKHPLDEPIDRPFDENQRVVLNNSGIASIVANIPDYYREYLNNTADTRNGMLDGTGGVVEWIDVVRVGRYRLIESGVQHEQLFLLEQTAFLRPHRKNVTVGKAINDVLRNTGFSLCPQTSQTSSLLNSALPDVHRELPPMPLYKMLQVLVGAQWKVVFDEQSRSVCFSPLFVRLKVEKTPTVNTASVATQVVIKPSVAVQKTQKAVKKTAEVVQSKPLVVMPEKSPQAQLEIIPEEYVSPTYQEVLDMMESQQ